MVGCSGINSSNDGGGISLRLPECSIRSVYSEGLISDPEGGSVANYVVRVRRDGNVEAEESASPGSTITIDGLLPGQYTVAVLGVNSSGLVTYYGRSSEVTVSSRETSAASVSMQNVEGILVSVSCSWVDDDGNWNSSIVTGYDASFIIKAVGLGKNLSYSASASVSDSTASFGIFTSEYGGSSSATATVQNFLEPGITYNFTVTASSSGWERSYSGSSTLRLENGINHVSVDLH